MTKRNDTKSLARSALMAVGGPPCSPPAMPNLVIPGHMLVSILHQGGQGVVYLALQDSTNRRVAIKVLKNGRISSEIEQLRFEREVQILSRLKHRGIVTIHDCGVVDGLAYMVMDYVDGVPLDRYQADAGLDQNESVAIMVEIVEAVEAAHTRGIIHRDLKPANILVDESGSPILVDFGLARLACPTGVEPSLTQTGQFIGTLPWAAPEQVRCDESEIDTRTDVYAMGAIFYQLLTGQVPHDINGPIDQVFNRISTATPPAPRSINPSISDELDTIITKCLSTEPGRRYPTAGELAADLRRYQNGEPITARPPSFSYILRKQFQRNRVKAVAVTVTLAALTLGGAAAFAGMWWALTERTAARLEAEAAERARFKAAAEQKRAERTTAFMNSILEGANPAVARGRDATLLKELLDDAVNRLESDELNDAPLARLELLTTLSRTFNHLNEFAKARDTAEEAIRRADDEGLSAIRWKVAALQHLAYATLKIGTWDEAERIAQQASELARTQLGTDDPFRYEAIEIHALVLLDQYKWQPCLTLLEEVYEGKARIAGEFDPDTLTTLMNMGKPLSWLGRIDESIDVLERALHGFEKTLGRDHVQVASTLGALADKYRSKGELEQARALLEEAVDIHTRHRGPEHGHTLFARQNLGKVLIAMGRTDEGEALMRDVLPHIRKRYGVSQNTATAAYSLGTFLFNQKRYEESIVFLEESHQCWVAATSENHQYALTLLGWVANAQMHAGRLEDAAATNDRVLELAATNEALDDKFLAPQVRRYGVCERKRGRFPEAVKFLRQSFEMELRTGAGTPGDSAKSADELANTFEEWAAHTASDDPLEGELLEQATCWRSGLCRDGLSD